jgi:hypothetical protein
MTDARLLWDDDAWAKSPLAQHLAKFARTCPVTLPDGRAVLVIADVRYERARQHPPANQSAERLLAWLKARGAPAYVWYQGAVYQGEHVDWAIEQARLLAGDCFQAIDPALLLASAAESE